MQGSNHSGTAIILFTRTAHEEIHSKDYGAGSKASNSGIARKLISHSEFILRRSGLPSFIVSSSKQKGNSFGERITNAIGEKFSSGFENVIVIGNDCPALRPADVKKAAQQIEHNAYVAGPDNRGGLYLIGINRNYFDPQTFACLPWNSDVLADAFIEMAGKQNASFILLENKSDINYASELKIAIKSNRIIFQLKEALASILFSRSRNAIRIISAILSFDRPIHLQLRAPPVN